MQLTIARRRNVVKNFDFSRSFAGRVGKHIEVLQNRLSINGNRHCAATLSASARILRAVQSFSEMKAQLVGPGLQWNVVVEVTLPAVAIDDGVLCTPYVLHGTRHRGAPRKVAVRVPDFAGVVDILAIRTGEDVDLFSYRKSNRWLRL